MVRQKLLHKVRWMRWRVIVVKKPVAAWPETRSFSFHGITQSFQNFNVIFFVDRLTSWSKFVVHNTLTIEKKKDINAGRILFGHTSYKYLIIIKQKIIFPFLLLSQTLPPPRLLFPPLLLNVWKKFVPPALIALPQGKFNPQWGNRCSIVFFTEWQMP